MQKTVVLSLGSNSITIILTLPSESYLFNFEYMFPCTKSLFTNDQSSELVFQVLENTRLFYFIYLFSVLGPHLGIWKVPRLGVEWELQLLAYTTATETLDLNFI